MCDGKAQCLELHGEVDMIAGPYTLCFCCSFNRQIEQLSALPDDKKKTDSEGPGGDFIGVELN